MCEVTRKNFDEKYPQIIDDLHSASFIAIDCEFSGLFDDDCHYSLFDTPKDRFNKLQHVLKDYIIIQLGLSTFQYERNSNKFITSTYSFYLVPSEMSKKKSKFMCEINSINFLCEHNFNFNKLFYEGIPYLNNTYEADVRKMFREQTLGVDQKDIEKYCSMISDWVDKALEGCEISITVEDHKLVLAHILHIVIRERFDNTWTYYYKPHIIKVRKISESEYKNLILNKEEDLYIENKFIDSILGFSKIIREIENLKKPIIGHNCLMDLIMIYKQFYNPSIVSYKNFKSSIIKIFPSVYDTKFMSFRLRDILSKNDIWKNSNSLSNLYTYLKVEKGATLMIFTPLIQHRDEKFTEGNNFHDAGFDSYCTGFCFIKLAHIFSTWDEKKKTFFMSTIQTTSTWLLGAVTNMKNQLNISNGQANNMVLDGIDPQSSRPSLLHIESTNKKPLNVPEISKLIAKYGCVDIKPITKWNILMAVANTKQKYQIINCLKDYKEFRIRKYRFLKHSTLGKALVIGTIGVMAAVLAIFSSRTLKNVEKRFFILN